MTLKIFLYIMNKLQWRRQKNRDLELYIYEKDRWVHYTKSLIKQPDLKIKGASRGFPTLQYALKLGYVLLDMQGNPIKQTHDRHQLSI